MGGLWDPGEGLPFAVDETALTAGAAGGRPTARVGDRVFGAGRRGTWRRQVARRLLAAALAGGVVLGCLAVARVPEGGPRRAVVVATTGMPVGHEVAPGDLTVAWRPADHVPAGAAPSTAALVGRRLSSPVAPGEVLTTARVLGDGLLRGRPAGEVAAHVIVADPGAAAMVRPGDRVDVVTGAGSTLAHAAVVLAVTGGAAGGAAGSGPGTAAGGLAPGVPFGADETAGLVIAVTPDVAARLASAPRDETGGPSLTVVLRPAP